jgi:hypothetical protein
MHKRQLQDDENSVDALPGDKHIHIDNQGLVHYCYHSCKNTLLSASFWLGVTLSYPLEHYLWESVPPFSYIAAYFGLLH